MAEIVEGTILRVGALELVDLNSSIEFKIGMSRVTLSSEEAKEVKQWIEKHIEGEVEE